jgi:hypothetical protein
MQIKCGFHWLATDCSFWFLSFPELLQRQPAAKATKELYKVDLDILLSSLPSSIFYRQYNKANRSSVK